MKIVFLNSHPISYFSDMYQFLYDDLDFEVWYCSKYGLNSHYDKEFNSVRKLSGLLGDFKYRFLTNMNLFSSGNEKLFDTINPFLIFNILSLNKGDLNKLYSSSDIIVLPSGYGETWGLVINEALEFGLPVIISDRVGSAIDLCEKNGYIFKYKSSNALAKKLEKLLSLDDKDFNVMVKNSFRIKNLYSFETIKNNLKKLYN